LLCVRLPGGVERYRAAMQWCEETKRTRTSAAKKPVVGKKAVGE
jgi:hypothetical protein